MTLETRNATREYVVCSSLRICGRARTSYGRVQEMGSDDQYPRMEQKVRVNGEPSRINRNEHGFTETLSDGPTDYIYIYNI